MFPALLAVQRQLRSNSGTNAVNAAASTRTEYKRNTSMPDQETQSDSSVLRGRRPRTVTAELVLDKEMGQTWRYKESDATGRIIGQIYLSKTAVHFAFGGVPPRRLHVTLETE